MLSLKLSLGDKKSSFICLLSVTTFLSFPQFSLRISEHSSLKQIVSLDATAPYVKFHTKASEFEKTCFTRYTVYSNALTSLYSASFHCVCIPTTLKCSYRSIHKYLRRRCYQQLHSAVKCLTVIFILRAPHSFSKWPSRNFSFKIAFVEKPN